MNIVVVRHWSPLVPHTPRRASFRLSCDTRSWWLKAFSCKQSVTLIGLQWFDLEQFILLAWTSLENVVKLEVLLVLLLLSVRNATALFLYKCMNKVCLIYIIPSSFVFVSMMIFLHLQQSQIMAVLFCFFFLSFHCWGKSIQLSQFSVPLGSKTV